MSVPRENIPQPDPSSLTTSQLDKAVASLRAEIEARLKCTEENLEHQQKRIDTRQAAITAEVGHLEKLHAEIFKGVDQRFEGLKTQTDKIAELQQKALEAALQAAKELVSVQNKSSTEAIVKSETGFNKQIEGIGTLISQNTKVTDGKFEDLKDNLNKQESRITAAESSKKGGSEGMGMVGQVFLGACVLIGLIVSVVTLFISLRPGG